jgi:hypothetical protein
MLPLLLTLRQLDQCRSWDGVTRELSEDIEQDTRIIRLIKARRRHTPTQFRRSTTANLDINALRVRLSAIRLARSVQREDLMANHVVARCEVGDRQVPGEIVLDEVVGDPGAGVVAGFPGSGLDLGPEEGGWGHGGEVPGDGGDVFLDGADVRSGPCVLYVTSISFVREGRARRYVPI